MYAKTNDSEGTIKSKHLIWQIPLLLVLTMTGTMIMTFLGGIVYLALLTGVASIHLRRDSQPRSRRRALEIYLLYLLVGWYGVGSIRGFIGHMFLADTIAQDIGWAAGSPFQTELAFYHLGIGVVALAGIWLRGNLIPAVIVSKSLFLYGAAYTHIHDALVNGNLSPSNVGFDVLYLNDLIMPTALLGLLVAYKLADRNTVQITTTVQPEAVG
jgi:hypothetical protein